MSVSHYFNIYCTVKIYGNIFIIFPEVQTRRGGGRCSGFIHRGAGNRGKSRSTCARFYSCFVKTGRQFLSMHLRASAVTADYPRTFLLVRECLTHWEWRGKNSSRRIQYGLIIIMLVCEDARDRFNKLSIPLSLLVCILGT